MYMHVCMAVKKTKTGIRNKVRTTARNNPEQRLKRNEGRRKKKGKTTELSQDRGSPCKARIKVNRGQKKDKMKD